jgi:hypothetical protein
LKVPEAASSRGGQTKPLDRWPLFFVASLEPK